MDNIKLGILRNVSHWNIIDHIPYTVYITLGYLLCDWRFVPLNPLHLLPCRSLPSFLAATYVFPVSVNLVLFCLYFFSLDSTLHWRFEFWCVFLLCFLGLQSSNHINRVVSHPTLPVTITAHEDRHIKFFDNKTGK